MKKILRQTIVALGVSATFIFAMSVPAMALEQSVTATLWVAQLNSVTIEDNGPNGFAFGDLFPGQIDASEVGQFETNGALTLELAEENNVQTDMLTRADDFTANNQVMPIDNLKFGLIADPNEGRQLTKQYARLAVLSPGSEQELWMWLSIPEAQAPGTYVTTFYFNSTAVQPEI